MLLSMQVEGQGPGSLGDSQQPPIADRTSKSKFLILYHMNKGLKIMEQAFAIEDRGSLLHASSTNQPAIS